MWIPTSVAELEQAAERGDLAETHTLDAKLALPSPKRNHDLAVDVAAMTVAGGVLIYGLGEDDSKRLTKLSPIGDLEAARERISQIVQTSISEPPFIEVHALEKPGDENRGYLVVLVPQSDRAPHQVISGKDMRYYGRGSTGNRVLSEGEVAALYARREQWGADRDVLLDAEIERSPAADADYGYMIGYIRPVTPSDSFLDSLAADEQTVQRLLLSGAQSWGEVWAERRSPQYNPDFRRASYLWRRGADGWSLSTRGEDDEGVGMTSRLDLDFDGSAHFLCDRIAERLEPEVFAFFEVIAAGNLASFLSAMGALFKSVGYYGYVDVGVVLTGIQGAKPYEHWPRSFSPAFSNSTARRTTRVSVDELNSDPKGITLTLIGRVLHAMRGSSYTPFLEENG